ncbi:arginyl-tRNA synthetase [Pullulanibacillus pueri]|uniref:Arginine--tRNA ligase n=1 Tax=Pullulanibacillus pueri TaxID=1437324 RepID=A0A8J2ZYL5_9BACL|nr:arginine--tRNA ligase [Pullulanibacillus pueri]MBM7681693.1 arginyl-tRNA synthetase [Pullulanibacillus pueri]GGH87035.1 arginine--tRNA ligase [Pullulanibacillus pueri]
MTIVEKVKQQLKHEIRQAVLSAGLAGELEIPDVILEVPKEKSHGDYATNMAMQLARIAKKAPRQIAEDIASHIDREKAHIQSIEVAGPGFINFFLDTSYLTTLIPEILQSKDGYGASDKGQGKKIQIEFVSANPTGSLHLGHARGAAVGDVLVRVLNKAGYAASGEYYINDAGNQIENLARSIEARYFQALGEEREVPEDGYQGKDIVAFGQELAKEHGDGIAKMDDVERIGFLRRFGVDHLIAGIRADLADFRVAFDEWFSESTLYTSGEITDTLEKLKAGGHTYEEDGALWLRSTDFGDDKDRVLIKSDGTYTYLTPDIAYHRNKLERGFDRLINVWGADHHGYIPRMKAALAALGYDAERLDVVIIQLVSLFKNGEKVKMSKRTGKAVTLRELMEEVGTDAMRYFFAMRSSDSHLDFDIDLALSKSNENPVFYVQYAHARICSMLKKAEGYDREDFNGYTFKHIDSEKEIELLKKLGEFPEAVVEAAERLAPQRLTNYVFELAAALHSFYNAEKVIDAEDQEKTAERVALMKAVKITLKNAMELIGVQAPEQM